MERVPISFTVEPAVYARLQAGAATINLKPADYARRLFDVGYAARVGAERGMPAGDAELDAAVRTVFPLLGLRDVRAIAKTTGLPKSLVENIMRGFREVAGERDDPQQATRRAQREAGHEAKSPAVAAQPAKADPQAEAAPAGDMTSSADMNTPRGSSGTAREAPGTDGGTTEVASAAPSVGLQAGSPVISTEAAAASVQEVAAGAEDAAMPGTGGAPTGKRSPRAYSEEDRAYIKERYAAGDKVGDIAAALGRSRGSIEMYISNRRDQFPRRR